MSSAVLNVVYRVFKLNRQF